MSLDINGSKSISTTQKDETGLPTGSQHESGESMPAFTRILIGGLWHTTSEERYKSIIESGAIEPNPNIPDSERWSTTMGEKHYPYVRKLGGVSLFDFERFGPDEYSKKCPSSTWNEFVPYRPDWDSAVWIEVDRDQVHYNIMSSDPL